MPPRYVYWTIIAGGLPTAFRAADREELLPTFNRIREKHPDAEMKYFARGRLWTSQEEARLEAEARRAASAQRQSARRGISRGRDWRPGGEHRDPRQPFKEAKKERNQERRKDRFERRLRSGTQGPWRDRPPRENPQGDPFRPQAKPGEVPGPAPRPRPPGSANRPPGPPERGRYPRGPVRDRRRRS